MRHSPSIGTRHLQGRGPTARPRSVAKLEPDPPSGAWSGTEPWLSSPSPGQWVGVPAQLLRASNPWSCPRGPDQRLKASSALAPLSMTLIFEVRLTPRNAKVFSWARCFQTRNVGAGSCPESHQDTLQFLPLFVVILVPTTLWVRPEAADPSCPHHTWCPRAPLCPVGITTTPSHAALSSSRASLLPVCAKQKHGSLSTCSWHRQDTPQGSVPCKGSQECCLLPGPGAGGKWGKKKGD